MTDLIEKYKTLIGVVLIIGIIAGGGVLWWQRTADEPITVSYAEDSDEADAVAEGVAEDAEFSIIYIDVEGAVKHPGVYELQPGDRVEDALQAAGGLTKSADLDRFDLSRAARVTDEQKIYMPRKGEQPAASAPAEPEVGEVAGSSSSGCTDINTASAGQLDELYGIGEARATDIINSRPYATVDELVSKQAVPQYVFDGIVDEICVQ